MSITTEITRLQTAKEDIKASITGKGVTVPDGTKLDGMAALIDEIEQSNTKQWTVTLASALPRGWFTIVEHDEDLRTHRLDDNMMVVIQAVDIDWESDAATFFNTSSNKGYHTSSAALYGATIRSSSAGIVVTPQNYSVSTLIHGDNVIYIDEDGNLKTFASGTYKLKAGTYRVVASW